MTAYASTDEGLGLFSDDPELLHGKPVMVTGICDICGAVTEPIPLTESGDTSEKWTGTMWAMLAIEAHKHDGCPGPPPATPGVHLRPANPNYAP